jgi:RNA polymerase sigma-70 factor (ECF subfamily)
MKRAEKRQLLVDHYLDFYNVAMAILRDDDDAREAVQEALVKTMTQLGVKDVCKYCARVVRNNSLAILKRRSRQVSLDEVMLVTNYEHEDLLRLVAEKKAELSNVARAIVEMHDEDGYTLSEVAGMVQMSVSTVKRILAQAHYELRKKIESEI